MEGTAPRAAANGGVAALLAVGLVGAACGAAPTARSPTASPRSAPQAAEPAPPRTEGWPRVVARGPSEASAEGLPAISRDGTTLALVEDFSTGGEDMGFAVVFRRAEDLGLVESVVVYSRRDDGLFEPLPPDGWGATLASRARRLDQRLARDGYRILERLEEGVEGPDVLEGAGLRLVQEVESGAYEVRDAADDRARARGRLGTAPRSCMVELGDDEPAETPLGIVAAWADRATGLLLLWAGDPYHSPSCWTEGSHVAVRLDP